MKAGVRVVLVTAPQNEAGEVARAVVEGRLAACVNILPSVTSVYRWEGAVTEDQESLLIIKTAADRIEQLKDTILDVHSYDVPEFVVLNIDDGLPDYLSWVLAESEAKG